MDDQRDNCGLSACNAAARGRDPEDRAAVGAPGRPHETPLSLCERAELRIRLAELCTVVDTIETALQHTRHAGVQPASRHQRVAAQAAAEAHVLHAIAARLGGPS